MSEPSERLNDSAEIKAREERLRRLGENLLGEARELAERCRLILEEAERIEQIEQLKEREQPPPQQEA